MKREMKSKKRRTWTFEPADDVRSLMARAINSKVGRGGQERGLRSRLINKAIRLQCVALAGKREENHPGSEDLQVPAGPGQSVGQSTAK